MAKRKAALLAEIMPETPEENNFPAVENNSPETAKPTRIVKNRLHQEWISEVPAAAEQPADQLAIDGGNVGVIEDDDDDETPNEQLFRDLSLSGATNYVSVWEMTNWERDRKASTTADGRIFCGTIPIPEHVGSIGELTTFVQEAYAVPPQKIYHFRVVIRAGRRLFKHVPVMTVRSVASARPADDAAAAVIVQPPPPAPDPMAQLESSLAIVERVSKMVRPTASAIAPPAAPAEELSEAGAMLKLIEADPDKLERLRRRFFGEGPTAAAADEDDPLSLSGILKLAMPGLTQMGIAWLQSRQGTAPANGQPASPLPTAAPTAGPPAMPVAEDMLFANLWNAASQQAPVEQFADWVFNFEKQAPEIGPYLTAMLDFPSTVQLSQFIRRLTPGVDPRAPVEPLMLWFETFVATIRKREEQREAEELLEGNHDSD